MLPVIFDSIKWSCIALHIHKIFNSIHYKLFYQDVKKGSQRTEQYYWERISEVGAVYGVGGRVYAIKKL